MEIIDLSLTIDNECMTCGTPWHEKVAIKQLGRVCDVGRNTTSIMIGSHAATHIDAPKHFYDAGYGVEALDLNVLCGDVSIVDFTYFKEGDVITLLDVESIDVTERMIFRFDWHKWWKTDKYYEDFPFFSMEAAKYLVDQGMKLMALDTPSPDAGKNIEMQGQEDSPVHKYFMKNEIVIIEYLTNTDKINRNKKWKLIALPLKIKGADGSPARIILTEE